MAVTAAGIACLPMCSYSKTQTSVSLRWCTDLHSCTKTKTSSFVSLQRPHPKNLFCRVSWSSVTHSTKRLSSNFFSPIKAAAEPMEQTYVMVKPDGVQRGLVGEIISRFERKGFLLKGLKLYQCSKELAEEHYVELKTKPFFGKLIKYITSGPVVCMAWEGPGIVAAARKLIGVTNPLQAEPGTIRGDLAVHVGRNVVHGSDSKQSGDREIALWFKQDELCEWTQEIDPWLKE